MQCQMLICFSCNGLQLRRKSHSGSGLRLWSVLCVNASPFVSACLSLRAAMMTSEDTTVSSLSQVSDVTALCHRLRPPFPTRGWEKKRRPTMRPDKGPVYCFGAQPALELGE